MKQTIVLMKEPMIPAIAQKNYNVSLDIKNKYKELEQSLEREGLILSDESRISYGIQEVKTTISSGAYYGLENRSEKYMEYEVSFDFTLLDSLDFNLESLSDIEYVFKYYIWYCETQLKIIYKNECEKLIIKNTLRTNEDNFHNKIKCNYSIILKLNVEIEGISREAHIRFRNIRQDLYEGSYYNNITDSNFLNENEKIISNTNTKLLILQKVKEKIELTEGNNNILENIIFNFKFIIKDEYYDETYSHYDT
jgi:hypothetical protein